MSKNKKVIIMLIIVTILLILDQGLKIYCIKYKKVQAQEIANGITLKYEESNKGAWGIGQNGVITYAISTIVVLGVVLKFFINQIEQINLGVIVGIAMLLAGGLSNMMDKLFHGAVINCIQIFNLPSINLSFILIVLAWIELAAIFAFNFIKGNDEKNA